MSQYDVIRWARKTKRRLSGELPVKFQVLGERCSGTNYVSRLITANFPMRQGRGTVWKHGFPAFQAAPAEVVFVVVFREVFGWLASMYGKPWHTTSDLREKPFSEFIRAPWTTIVDTPRHFALDSSVRGQPLNLDLDPISGAPFENLLAMRGAKMRALLSLPERGAKVVYVTHAEATKNPQALIRLVAAATEVAARSALTVPKGHFGYKWKTRNVSNRPNDLISEEDRAFILNSIDRDLEAAAGLTYE